MKRQLFGMLLCAMAATACSKSQPAAKDNPAALTEEERADEAMAAKLDRLTVDQVAAKLDAKDGHTFVFDANYHKAYVKSHVPTATWFDDEKASALLPADKSAFLIFYCKDET
ncbi:MAG TPA: hypothetical protein VGM39_24865 [Kofleriaceae bacterium]|jgi:hypothetical protein